MDADYDAFISYSHRNEEWVVRTLLPCLETSGLKICIDFRDFKPGKAAIHNMRDAVKRSRCVLLVLTPQWVSSEWATFEGVLVQTSDPAGLRERTIPLLAQQCEIPEEIAILTYVDFTRADREGLAWHQLLTALGAPRLPAAVERLQRAQRLLSRPSDTAPLEEHTAVEDETPEIQKEAHVEGRYNIVVMGKTGVGKSALVNYLVGRPVMRVGIGKPVTKPGFHKREFDFHGIPARLFDSGGIELKDPEAWRRELRKELNMRGTDRPAEEWFHTIFYCVAAPGARIEDFEIDAINACRNENYRVVIVLTKADMVSRSKTNALASTIAKEIGDVPVVEVCSERNERRDGTWEEPSGIEELRLVIMAGLHASITARLPDRCVKLLLRHVRRWQSEQRSYIEKHLTASNGVAVFAALQERLRRLIEDLSGRRAEQMLHDEVKRTLELYDALAANIGTVDFKAMVRRRRRALAELELDVPGFVQSGNWWMRTTNEYFGWYDKELRGADSAALARYVEYVGETLGERIERWRTSIRKQIDRVVAS